ncbi:hypothetical protein ACWD4E_42680, partial [Streptomyces sp. NPDC002540]
MSDDLQNGGPSEAAAVAKRLTDPEWLVNTDPARVLAVLDGATGREEVLAAAVYRVSAHVHRDADVEVRRQLLALDAARYGDGKLAARLAAATVEGEPGTRWGVEWATGSQIDPRLRCNLTNHTGAVLVLAVATAVVEGRPVAVTGSDDGTVRVWDLATGQQVG